MAKSDFKADLTPPICTWQTMSERSPGVPSPCRRLWSKDYARRLFFLLLLSGAQDDHEIDWRLPGVGAGGLVWRLFFYFYKTFVRTVLPNSGQIFYAGFRSVIEKWRSAASEIL
jgi:hypothetical protein